MASPGVIRLDPGVIAVATTIRGSVSITPAASRRLTLTPATGEMFVSPLTSHSSPGLQRLR